MTSKKTKTIFIVQEQWNDTTNTGDTEVGAPLVFGNKADAESYAESATFGELDARDIYIDDEDCLHELDPDHHGFSEKNGEGFHRWEIYEAAIA